MVISVGRPRGPGGRRRPRWPNVRRAAPNRCGPLAMASRPSSRREQVARASHLAASREVPTHTRQGPAPRPRRRSTVAHSCGSVRAHDRGGCMPARKRGRRPRRRVGSRWFGPVTTMSRFFTRIVESTRTGRLTGRHRHVCVPVRATKLIACFVACGDPRTPHLRAPGRA